MNKKLPSIVQVEQGLDKLRILKQGLQLTQPPHTPEKLDLISTIEQIEIQANQVLKVPQVVTEFNSHFNPLGWHAHDFINMELAEKANALARLSDFENAENLLVDYYVAKFNTYCLLLRGLPTYFEREHIIERAKERFLEEDYISCIPLVLMMADGFTNDVLNKGVFTKGVAVDAWDCLASYNEDIINFIKIITKTRRKINTEPLCIPYRNGIMHGLDVAYGNKLTAVKAWALLFTLREVLIKKRNEPEERAKFEAAQQKKLSELREFVTEPTEYIADQIATVEAFYDWKPQKTSEERALVPKSGLLSDYTPGTPEHCLVSFLCGWQSCNYGVMAKLIQLPKNLSIKKLAGNFRSALTSKHLVDFSINFIQEDCGGIAFETILTISESENSSWEKKAIFIIDNYVNNEKFLIYEKKGHWKINNVAIQILCCMRDKMK